VGLRNQFKKVPRIINLLMTEGIQREVIKEKTLIKREEKGRFSTA
jgi:hypothetical protein